MTCLDVLERLPWLCNGTLPDAERLVVVRHLRECEDCRREAADTYGLLREITDHPSPEDIVTFVSSPAGAGQARVRSHLEDCAYCREEVALASQSRKAVMSAPQPKQPAGRFAIHYSQLARAAAVLVLTASTGTFAYLWRQETLRASRLEQELDSRLRPTAATRIIDLLPTGALERESPSGGPGASVLPSSTANVQTTLILNSRIPIDAPEPCAIRLLAQDGRELWSSPRSLRGVNGEFPVQLPAGFVQSGEFRILLTCASGSSSSEPQAPALSHRETFRFRID